MEQKLAELKARLATVSDLQNAAAVLGWDQNTYLPPGGGGARGRHLATLRGLAHETFTDPAIGRLLDALQPYAEGLGYDADDASLLRVTRREYERATQVPPEFMARFTRHRSESFAAWTKARPADDFGRVAPYLEKTVDLSRELADHFPGYEHIADPLIDFADYGMRASTVSALFAELREALVPIARAITAQAPADDSCLQQSFPEAGQVAFFEDVIRRFGYDYEHGRHDKAPHPFTTSFSISDVRITYRVKEDHLGEALFSGMHEAGHAIYEQSIDPALEATPLAGGTSAGVHESQSRLWENLIGRSRPFWRFFYPRLQAAFPAQLESVGLETFYRAINKVEPSLIRTDADEVTYNLHVMLRFDLELALLEGRLAVRDLPDAWRERYRADLGIAPPDERDGVLQDTHWYSGRVGGVFQGYTLGNILSAQFYAAALKAHPEIEAETAAGEFGTLHGWLTDQIYRHGSKFTASELVERVTGGPLRIEPYIDYLRKKYGQLYDLG
jgi:carboxypeptidase Taq